MRRTLLQRRIEALDLCFQRGDSALSARARSESGSGFFFNQLMPRHL